MIEIEITECHQRGETWISKHRTEDVQIAVERAIRARWGKAAHFHRENDVSQGRDALAGSQYGQIGEPARNNPGVSNMITGRIRINARIV